MEKVLDFVQGILGELLGSSTDSSTVNIITYAVLGVCALLIAVIIFLIVKIIIDNKKVRKAQNKDRQSRKKAKAEKKAAKAKQQRQKASQKKAAKVAANVAKVVEKTKKKEKPAATVVKEEVEKPAAAPAVEEISLKEDIVKVDFDLPDLSDDVPYENESSASFLSLQTEEQPSAVSEEQREVYSEADVEDVISGDVNEPESEEQKRMARMQEFYQRRQNAEPEAESNKSMEISYVSDEVGILLGDIEPPKEEDPNSTAALTNRLNNRERIKVSDDMIVLPRTFESFLAQSSDENKLIYNEIKNSLLSFQGVHSKIFNNYEAFRCKGLQAKIMIKGKTIYLYLRILPDSIDPEWVNIKVKDMSSKKAFAETPTEIRVTGKKKINASVKLIEEMFAAQDIKKMPDYITEDFISQYPYNPKAIIFSDNLDID